MLKKKKQRRTLAILKNVVYHPLPTNSTIKPYKPYKAMNRHEHNVDNYF